MTSMFDSDVALRELFVKDSERLRVVAFYCFFGVKWFGGHKSNVGYIYDFSLPRDVTDITSSDCIHYRD